MTRLWFVFVPWPPETRGGGLTHLATSAVCGGEQSAAGLLRLTAAHLGDGPQTPPLGRRAGGTTWPRSKKAWWTLHVKFSQPWLLPNTHMYTYTHRLHGLMVRSSFLRETRSVFQIPEYSYQWLQKEQQSSGKPTIQLVDLPVVYTASKWGSMYSYNFCSTTPHVAGSPSLYLILERYTTKEQTHKPQYQQMSTSTLRPRQPGHALTSPIIHCLAQDQCSVSPSSPNVDRNILRKEGKTAMERQRQRKRENMTRHWKLTSISCPDLLTVRHETDSLTKKVRDREKYQDSIALYTDSHEVIFNIWTLCTCDMKQGFEISWTEYTWTMYKNKAHERSK